MADSRDPRGHPTRQTDEFGNPTQQTATTGTGLTDDKAKHGAGTGLLGTGVGHHGKAHQLRRSGSPSSSSSEDDGMGGRRKKGLKEKVKEKMPGQLKQDPARADYGTSTTDQYGQPQEKKGMMEKIKEKLPGQY